MDLRQQIFAFEWPIESIILLFLYNENISFLVIVTVKLLIIAWMINSYKSNLFAVRQKGILCSQRLHMIFCGPKGPLMYFCGLKAAQDFINYHINSQI